MKRNVFLFLLFAFLGIQYIPTERGYVYRADNISLVNKVEAGFIKGLSDIDSKTINSEGSKDHNSTKKSKKRKRGTRSVIICPASDSLVVVISFEIEVVFPRKAFYFLRPHYALTERGPPYSFLVS